MCVYVTCIKPTELEMRVYVCVVSVRVCVCDVYLCVCVRQPTGSSAFFALDGATPVAEA